MLGSSYIVCWILSLRSSRGSDWSAPKFITMLGERGKERELPGTTLIAIVCRLPAANARTELTVGTTTGSSRSHRSPYPSWPYRPHPQARSLPAVVSIRLCDTPHAMIVCSLRFVMLSDINATKSRIFGVSPRICHDLGFVDQRRLHPKLIHERETLFRTSTSPLSRFESATTTVCASPTPRTSREHRRSL